MSEVHMQMIRHSAHVWGFSPLLRSIVIWFLEIFPPMIISWRPWYLRGTTLWTRKILESLFGVMAVGWHGFMFLWRGDLLRSIICSWNCATGNIHVLVVPCHTCQDYGYNYEPCCSGGLPILKPCLGFYFGEHRLQHEPCFHGSSYYGNSQNPLHAHWNCGDTCHYIREAFIPDILNMTYNKHNR